MIFVVKGDKAMLIIRPDRTNVDHQPVDGDVDSDNAAFLKGLRQGHSDLRRGRELVRERPDDRLWVLHGIAVPAAAARVIWRRLPRECLDLAVVGVEK